MKKKRDKCPESALRGSGLPGSRRRRSLAGMVELDRNGRVGMAYLLELLKALLYGALFAVTEWLPVGSEAHIMMLEGVLPFELYPDAELNRSFLSLFVAVMRLAAAGSVFAVFYKRIWPFSKRKSEERRRSILRIWLLTLIPAAVFLLAAVLIGTPIRAKMSSPAVLAGITILCGILLVLSERYIRKPHVFELNEMTLKETGAAGLAQILSVIPGVSRSGTAILGGRFAGMNRTSAAELMCCLAVPSLLGTGLLSLSAVKVPLTLWCIPVFLVGICGVFFMTVFAVRGLLSYLRSGGLALFGYYRVIAGLVLLILALVGAVPEGMVF